ncbi:PH domain-containing protein [Demequina sp.]|uniref:PH domain-containing protein n=1 Tax=Demequina sp. TaxID=2050685 RepID=UPI0025CC9AE3|nr:PH domain-containing protein [Demequina sp.]
MAYPRNLLAPGERIIIDSNPHWKALLGPILVALVSIGAVIAVWVWTGSASMSDGARTTIGIVVGVLATVVVVWWAVSPFIRWASTHFVVTDRRVIYRSGVFTKNGIDIPIARINTVQFRHGLIDRMFRAGTLSIESASDDPLDFDDIPDVENVYARLHEQIMEHIDGESGRRSSRPAADPPPAPQNPPADTEPPAAASPA